MTVDRSKLLDAAARLYGELGFRGATTRRIADEAGVNEITIFRHFGSKEALIDEALRTHANGPRVPDLPLVPHDPAAELTTWCDAVLAHLNDSRTLIRRMMSEMEERPAVAPCIGDGPTRSAQQLEAYVTRLLQSGFVPAGTSRSASRAGGAVASDPDVHTAVSMLMSSLFADAMGREMMPAMYPQPRERAASAYVALFLRALDAHADSVPAASLDVARSA